MVILTHPFTPAEIAAQLEWALADPNRRIFADDHRRWALEILHWAAMALDPDVKMRLRQQEAQRRGVRVLRMLKDTRQNLSDGWIRPSDKPMLPKFKGEDFQRYSDDPPHCLISACKMGDTLGLANALGFRDPQAMDRWEDTQSEGKVIGLLDRVIASYEK